MNNKIEELQTKINQPKEWPQIGDGYVYIISNGDTSMMTTFNNNDAGDKYRKATGNTFHTTKEAEYHRDVQLLAGKIKANNDFVPDWENASQKKWSVGWDYEDDKPTSSHTSVERFNSTVFESNNSIRKALKNISDTDLKYMIEKGLL